MLDLTTPDFKLHALDDTIALEFLLPLGFTDNQTHLTLNAEQLLKTALSEHFRRGNPLRDLHGLYEERGSGKLIASEEEFWSTFRWEQWHTTFPAPVLMVGTVSTGERKAPSAKVITLLPVPNTGRTEYSGIREVVCEASKEKIVYFATFRPRDSLLQISRDLAVPDILPSHQLAYNGFVSLTRRAVAT